MWAKFTGFLAVVAGYFFFKSKMQAHEIEELEEEVEAGHKEKVITNIVEKAEMEAEKHEEAEKSNINDSDWRNNI